jgi:hypothetical protein
VVLEYLAARFDEGTDYAEAEVNDLLGQFHEDYASPAAAWSTRGANANCRCLPTYVDRWEISANLGRHEREGIDARGWLWEITRGDQIARVVIEISRKAWSSDPRGLPEDTRQALATDGRTELLKVLGEEAPPAVIRCGSVGCTHLTAEEVSRRRG